MEKKPRRSLPRFRMSTQRASDEAGSPVSAGATYRLHDTLGDRIAARRNRLACCCWCRRFRRVVVRSETASVTVLHPDRLPLDAHPDSCLQPDVLRAPEVRRAGLADHEQFLERRNRRLQPIPWDPGTSSRGRSRSRTARAVERRAVRRTVEVCYDDQSAPASAETVPSRSPAVAPLHRRGSPPPRRRAARAPASSCAPGTTTPPSSPAPETSTPAGRDPSRCGRP